MIKKTTLFLLLSLIVEFSFAQPITQSKEFGISDPASSWRNPILETQHEPLIRAGNSLLAVNDSVLMSKGMSFLMIDVLANDSTGSCSKGAIQLAIETPPTKALVEIDPNNELKYSILSSSFGKDSLVYKITCGGIESTAKVYITIEDLPVNVINGAAVCYELMPPDLPFTIRRKFSTTQGFTMGGSLGGDASGGDGYCIDGFTSPLVVDLNGDTKPEIIALGVYGTYGAGNARPSARYINIYNGQTGARMYSKDFGTNYSQSSGTGYHRPPSPLAVADLDRDGIVEIVYTRPDGAVIVYKPVFSGKTITAMNILWEASVKFKAPLSATNSPFNTPHPYIVDINGDGIPEVIVYNKVYNGQTGALLMAWQGAAATPKYSSLAANIGLVDNVYSTPTTQANANSIKGVALTGRRPSNGTYADEYVATPAIWDIDGDGIQEIVTGNRIYKIQINSLTNHTLNTYTTIEGPVSVTLTENTNGTKTTHYLSDGFTRVADIDGDGHLDIIVTQPCDNGSLDTKILVYIWDPRYPSQVKAAITYYSDGANGSYSIPFIGDINGKKDGWDGANYSLKLPEICILSGVVQINRSGRTGIKFHPLTDEAIRQGTAGSSGTAAGWDNNQTSNSNRRFNRPFSTNSLCGHIIGLTYDAAATEIEERLKLSWAMEHLDRSHSTGITLFDFDNDGTKDICYKDEATLRVLSPARGNNKMGRDYVTVNEKVSTPGTSILFSTPETNHHPDAVFGGTGLEYPVIADVNLDGCADIIVTRSADARNIAAANGYIMVFEYDSYKWSPSPPVWNQNLYNPLHINDDLTVPTNPQDLLTPYQDGMGNTITPYNGAWIQQPIVKYGEDYVPIVRKADAVLINMDVEVISLTSTKVTLTIRSIGDATIAALTPIAFYNGGTSGKPIESSIFINVREVGVDIFKNDIETIDFFLTGNFNNCLIWARIMDDNITFPSLGEDDCDTTNNTLSGRGCLYSHTQSGTPTLTVPQFVTTQLSDSICYGDSLLFGGQYLKDANTYYLIQKFTDVDCDSIVELKLTVNPLLTKTIAKATCVNAGYDFYGDMLYGAGIYNKRVASTTGACDTIVTLDLTIHQIDTTQLSTSICTGDSLFFYGQYLKLADTYYHTLQSTITGCDSVIELTLTLNPILTKTIAREACVNVGYSFYGDMLYATGIYNKWAPSTTGSCDTIVVLDLTIRQIDTTQLSTSICTGDSLFFYGHYLKLADTYYHTLQSTTTGCDSVIELILTMNPILTKNIAREACVNVGYSFYGDMLYATGIYNKLVPSTTSTCDTIVTLDLKVHQIDTTQRSASICYGDSLLFFGQYLKLADTYYHTLPSTITGCDSVIELTLTVNPLLTKTIETEACVNVGYHFYGDMLYATGIYSKRVASTTGACDTIVTLDLTVHQIDTTQQSASICYGDSLFFYGQYLKLA
ncbi:MAG: FG-GAP and VCBS repeat-containing protein, partial [Lentimicrobiaceae bacterium]|nr:FG-GAP and VCBS repeat-containing protein [Lentimicrobiaceae bacterium]